MCIELIVQFQNVRKPQSIILIDLLMPMLNRTPSHTWIVVKEVQPASGAKVVLWTALSVGGEWRTLNLSYTFPVFIALLYFL